MMKQMETIKTGVNYSAVSVGKMNVIVYGHEKGKNNSNASDGLF